MKKKRPRGTVLERFYRKVDQSAGCWVWTGFKNHGGYGVLRVGNSMTVASRVSWRIHYGEIPAGMVICHHCDNPACVRPDHLFVGTQGDNVRDSVDKGRFGLNRRQTHCRRGHLFTADNSYIKPAGKECKACAAIKARERRRRMLGVPVTAELRKPWNYGMHKTASGTWLLPDAREGWRR